MAAPYVKKPSNLPVDVSPFLNAVDDNGNKPFQWRGNDYVFCRDESTNALYFSVVLGAAKRDEDLFWVKGTLTYNEREGLNIYTIRQVSDYVKSIAEEDVFPSFYQIVRILREDLGEFRAGKGVFPEETKKPLREDTLLYFDAIMTKRKTMREIKFEWVKDNFPILRDLYKKQRNIGFTGLPVERRSVAVQVVPPSLRVTEMDTSEDADGPGIMDMPPPQTPIGEEAFLNHHSDSEEDDETNSVEEAGITPRPFIESSNFIEIKARETTNGGKKDGFCSTAELIANHPFFFTKTLNDQEVDKILYS